MATKYLVTAVCAFTKWVESEPLKDKSAKEVAKFLHRLICRHGCFDTEISDQGRAFVNSVSSELHSLTDAEHRMTSVNHTQCNGLTEKQNQTTQNMLLKYLDNQEEWADTLDSVLFAYRTSKHTSTGYSPFFLLYGRQPKLPGELLIENSKATMSEKVSAMEKIRNVVFGKSARDPLPTIPDDDAQEISDFIPECPVRSQKVTEDKLSRELSSIFSPFFYIQEEPSNNFLSCSSLLLHIFLVDHSALVSFIAVKFSNGIETDISRRMPTQTS